MPIPFPAMLLLSAAPSIASVVVYPDRAQVVRAVTLPCAEDAVAHFQGTPPAADAASLRAHADLGKIEGLRTHEQSRDEAFAPKLRELEARLHALERERAAEED